MFRRGGACTHHRISVLRLAKVRSPVKDTYTPHAAEDATAGQSIIHQATGPHGQTRHDPPARCSLKSVSYAVSPHAAPPKFPARTFLRRCTWWHACPLPRPHPPTPTPCLTRKSRPECDLPHHAARPIWHPLAHLRWINRQSTRSSSGDSTRRESARRGGDQQRDPPR